MKTDHPPKGIDASLNIRLFGSMQVEVDGQPIPRLRSRKALWVLALLALRQNRELDRQLLAGTLWPDVDMGQALSNLRPALSDLRRALGLQGDRIRLNGRHGVALDHEGSRVDVIEFDRLIEAREFESAVELYRGPLLEDCTEDWVFQERDRRRQDCLDAIDKWAQKCQAAGDHLAAIGLCTRATTIDRLGDSVHRRLMTALQESGDSNGAMQVYREFSDLLKRELNANPDRQTADLYFRIRQEVRVERRSEVLEPVGVAPQRTTAGNLPQPVSALVGREDEREELVALVHRSRLVTLTGFGGIGKTRLALAVAEVFSSKLPDGAWIVSLDSVSDGKSIAGQVAATFGLKEEPGQSLDRSITDHLRGKRLVLVLDNCEHLLQGAAKMAGDLLRNCSGVRTLATSRLALGVEGETAWPVPAMATPNPGFLPSGQTTLTRVLPGYEAVRLFLDRAEGVRSGFKLTTRNASSVASICFRLEGIPLAIELAAARMKAMTAEELALRLDDRLGLLTTGNRSAPARQQTLRATLDWSYGLLSEAERVLLRRLSVFAGGWTLETANAVCADTYFDVEIETLLASLVEKSLVVLLGARYRLLELVREYASEELQRSGEAELFRSRHRDWVVEFVEARKVLRAGPDAEERLVAIDAEQGNVRAALDESGPDRESADAALRIAGSLKGFWLIRGQLSEGLRYLSRALEHAEAQAPSVPRARALIAAAGLAGRQGDTVLCKTHAEAALAVSRALDDQVGIGNALGTLGNLAFTKGDYTSASEYFREVIEVLSALGDSDGLTQALFSRGIVAHATGDCREACSLLEESLSRYRASGAHQQTAVNLRNLGGVLHDLGDYDRARELLEESRLLHERLGDLDGVANAVQRLSSVARRTGDAVLATDLAQESLSIHRQLGNRDDIAVNLIALGEISCDLRQFSLAREHFDESLSLARELRNRRCELDCLIAMALMAVVESKPVEVAQRLAEGLDLCLELESAESQVRYVEVSALLKMLEGELLDAVRLSAVADAMRARMSAPRPPNELGGIDERLAEARLHLGDRAFAEAWAEGTSLDWRDALRL